jgi:hypothetical protein
VPTIQRPGPEPQWRLCAGPDGAAGAEPVPELPRRRVLGAVARRGLPGVIEASIVPAVIFLTVSHAWGARPAMLAVLAWGYTVMLVRALGGRRVPSVLFLAMGGLTVKTLVGVLSGSTFAYFAQPIATTLGIAALFVGSVLVGRPLVARVAHDFCPLSPEVAARPAVVRLFAGLTLLWAAAQLLNAGATLGMLLSLPTAVFVVVKPVTSLLISAVAVTVTVWWAMRTAHREALVFADA